MGGGRVPRVKQRLRREVDDGDVTEVDVPPPTTTSLAVQVSSSGGDSLDGERPMSLRLRSKTAKTSSKPTTMLTTLVSVTMLLVHLFYYSSGIWCNKLNIVSDDFNQDQHTVLIYVPIKVRNGIYGIAWSVLIVVCVGKFVAPIYTPIIPYPPCRQPQSSSRQNKYPYCVFYHHNCRN